MKKPSQRTWGGRFGSSPTKDVQAFSESVSFDWMLARHDIAGSIAHAKGLLKAGVLTRAEAGKMERGLRAIGRDIEAGKFKWDPAAEDVHMNIEAELVRRIGEPGKKLHTARSRNDQVATDLRLWLRSTVQRTQLSINELQKSILKFAVHNVKVVMPGYTHLQRAQPILLAHQLLAYMEMLDRDFHRFADCGKRANLCPLGSGAIAGSTIEVDRAYVAKLLGFSGVTANSIDAVSDRDFVVEYLGAAAIAGMHLSRLAEDLILWSSVEFGFITIGDAYTTGSSLMPQKKNPDIAELVRGKTGRLYGSLMAVLTVLKGLPLAYNRDLQEDKLPLFMSAQTLMSALLIVADMLRDVTVNRECCEAAASDPMLLATDLVDFLVGKGVAFREAHHQVGELVAASERTGLPLPTLAGNKYGPAAAEVFEVRRALASRKTIGSPSPENVRVQISRWKKLLEL